MAARNIIIIMNNQSTPFLDAPYETKSEFETFVFVGDQQHHRIRIIIARELFPPLGIERVSETLQIITLTKGV